MRILHTGDLHLGKRISEYSLMEDQEYILKQILNYVDEQRPDAVILAGDIYDKAQSSNEAVDLFDRFLTDLAKKRVQIFVISGNHDSPERIACMSEIVEIAGVHLSPVYNGSIPPTVLSDDHGQVNFYMLPFVKPAHVRRWFDDEEITSYTDAVRSAIAHMNIDPAERNVLITHQFVTGATRCESEEVSVGGSDNIDASVFDGFDYVALGHIHGPQNIGTERIRYAGSPLKYSRSEAMHTKSVTLVELGAKGDLKVTELPLKPLHDLVELRGSYAEITTPSFYRDKKIVEDFVHVVFTDEDTIPDVKRKLDQIYQRVLKVDYDNTRTRRAEEVEELEAVEQIDPLEIFGKLYETQNNQPMSEQQKNFVKELLEKIKGGETL